MNSEAETKIIQMLDVISVEVVTTKNELRAEIAGSKDELRGELSELRGELSELRAEVRVGFNRVDRRLGRLETRVEHIESDLGSFRGEFERRIAPLER
jgi:archaellum component FlaC